MSESTKIAMQLLSGNGCSTNKSKVSKQIPDAVKMAESSKAVDLAEMAALCMTRLDSEDLTP